MSSDEIVEEGAKPAPAKKSKKKLLIIGAAAGVLLLGGGGGAFFMMSGGEAKAEAAEGGHGEAAAEAEGGHGEAAAEGGGHGGGGEGKDAFVDVPPLVVNLRSPDGAARFLKVRFMLVPGPKATAESLKEKLPLILDAYQPFLRELRPEDLAGSAAVFRVKEEMLVRATAAAGPGAVKDVLIQDLVQQ
jgi:flagellar FliL protein